MPRLLFDHNYLGVILLPKARTKADVACRCQPNWSDLNMVGDGFPKGVHVGLMTLPSLWTGTEGCIFGEILPTEDKVSKYPNDGRRTRNSNIRRSKHHTLAGRFGMVAPSIDRAWQLEHASAFTRKGVEFN